MISGGNIRVTKILIARVAKRLGFTATQREDGSSIYGRPSAERPGRWTVTDDSGEARTAKPHEARKLNEAAARFGYPRTYSIETI